MATGQGCPSVLLEGVISFWSEGGKNKMAELKSEYMESVLIEGKGKTGRHQILEKHSFFVLGTVKWYGPWRQYCFFPSPECVFNTGCMNDICSFIKKLMEERKKLN
jgi:hypothetical protein